MKRRPPRSTTLPPGARAVPASRTSHFQPQVRLLKLGVLQGSTVLADEARPPWRPSRPIPPDLARASASSPQAFTLLNSHFSNVIGGDATLLAARDAYAAALRPKHASGDPASAAAASAASASSSSAAASAAASSAWPPPPTHILLVDRGRKARHVRNLDAAVAALEQALREANRTELSVLRWRPAASLEADIAAWQRAALVVAPHGAGLSNLLFAPAGCPVIEICYDEAKGMLCPAMYAALGANLHLPYWIVSARGGYASPSGLLVDPATLLAAATQALAWRDAPGAARLAGRGGGARPPRAPPLCTNASSAHSPDIRLK